MKYFLIAFLAACAAAQTPATLNEKDATQIGTRMAQLMESTAVAVPGLIHSSEPLRQNAETTLASLVRTPQNPAVTWQFINQVKAYLALSDSLPRPARFPAVADEQFAELRESLQKFQRHFEAVLESQSQSATALNADPSELKRYSEANTKMLPAGTNARVVFFGDSITDNWRLNEYFTGRDFVNRGINGQNTIQMLARFRQDVLALNPRAVVILAGTNDIASGLALNQIQDNLAMMGDLARAQGIRAAFASVLPVSDYHKAIDPSYEVTKTRSPAAIVALNRWLESYCKSEGFVYADYYRAMVDATGQLRVDFSDDGLHPNAKGYRAMSPLALDAVTKLLQLQQEERTGPRRRFGIMGK